MKPPAPLIIQWNCRSFHRSHPLLAHQATVMNPAALLLQETRGPASLTGYRTFQTPSILQTGSRATVRPTTPPGQAAVLIHKACKAALLDLSAYCTQTREIVAVKFTLPKQSKHQAFVVASVYYRPSTSTPSTGRPNELNWFSELLHLSSGCQLIIGGDFNARHTLWGYTRCDLRGKAIADLLEWHNLSLINTPHTPTRAALHAKQTDTCPDLTLATPKAIRHWEVLPVTWGSDHYPIQITLHTKLPAHSTTLKALDWNKYRELFDPTADSLLTFTDQIHSAHRDAWITAPATLNDTDSPQPDCHLIHLWQQAERLTHEYKTNGRRHDTLVKLRRHYSLLHDYQRTLATERWHSTCDRLSRVKSLKQLWSILRTLQGKGRPPPPLHHHFLHSHRLDELERDIIYTFFPHALDTPPQPLQAPTLPSTDPDLDAPFTLGELHAAIRTGRMNSAPGHDGITWQMLRNLPPEAENTLLTLINDLWTGETLPDHLKLAIINPIPKPGKDPASIANLRPISLTPTLCKLMERMILTRIQRYIEVTSPTSHLHPAQAGFRPNMGTHNCLWLLRRLLNRNGRPGPPDYLLALDMSKAFDNVDPTAILTNMSTLYPSQRTLNWVAAFLGARPIQLRSMDATHSPTTYYLHQGVPQGSILSPMLFNIAMLTLAQALERHTVVRYTIYADDVTLWTEAHDHAGDINSMQTELQAALLTVTATLPHLGLSLSPGKTELLCINGRRSVFPADQTIQLHLSPTEAITAKHGSIKVLGIPLHSCNSGMQWVRALASKWPSLLHAIRKISSKYGGARQRTTATMTRAIALGKILYATPILDLTSSAQALLQKLHNKALRTITGLPHFTPLTALYELSPLPSLTLLQDTARAGLHDRLQLTRQGLTTLAWDRREHLNPPSDSTQTAAFPALHPTHGSPPLLRTNTSARTRLASRHNSDPHAVFTDASVHPPQVTVAWTRPSTAQSQVYTFHHPFATPRQAELVAIWAAIKDTDEPTTIYSDSHEAVQEIISPATEDPAAQTIRTVLHTRQLTNKPCTVVWTPGHTQIGGNEEAHRLATSHSRGIPPATPPSSLGCTVSDSDHPYNQPLSSPQAAYYQGMFNIKNYAKYLRRTHLRTNTPPHLYAQHPLSRSQEVFLNKVLANSAITPAMVQRWQAHADTLKGLPNAPPARCPHCTSQILSDLAHLVINCPAFAPQRTRFLPTTVTSIDILRTDIRSDPHLLRALAEFGTTSGLARVV